MDVSRVDPEDVLVDWETVEPADISGEVDENFPRAVSNGERDDKVLVSIRVRPFGNSPLRGDTQRTAARSSSFRSTIAIRPPPRLFFTSTKF